MTRFEREVRRIARYVTSSSSLIKKAEVTLTDAEIKALPTTPITLVAAPGAGKIIVPISAFAITNFTAGAYGNITGALMAIYAPDLSNLSLPADIRLDSATNRFIQFTIPSINTDGSSILNTSQQISDMNNGELTIFDDFSGAGAYTGGNAANTLKVTVYYTIVDL